MDEALEYLLRPSGIMRRPVKLCAGWHKEAIGAMLGSKKDGGIVAILPGKMGGYYIKDYSTGKTRRVGNREEEEIDENAICFYEPLPLKKLKISDVVRYIVGLLRGKDYVWMLAAGAASAGAGMFIPAITRSLYGNVLAFGNMALLTGTILTLLCVSLAREMLDAIRGILNAFFPCRLIFLKITAPVNWRTGYGMSMLFAAGYLTHFYPPVLWRCFHWYISYRFLPMRRRLRFLLWW